MACGGWWGGCGGNIHAFSGGLSANECKYLNERDHKFYCTFFLFGGAVNFFFPTWKVVPGAYSDRFVKNCEPWNTPKEWFLSRKRPKEGERVG